MNISISENDFRDYLFENYRENLFELIIGNQESFKWDKKEFPPVHAVLRHKVECKINSMIESINSLTLLAKELRLEKEYDSVTRIDIFGNSEHSGITIIELKKSKQTERQSFTELLAYSHHFCSIFSGLKESNVTSILIAPMETRTVRDAYFQELVFNDKNVLALIPNEIDGIFTLTVYYPSELYYQYFEDNLLNDNGMLAVMLSFQLIDGFIDVKNNSTDISAYSKETLNKISNMIAHKLEIQGIHGFVYASQMWAEIANKFSYPNCICVVAMNPFASFRTSLDNEQNIYGDSNEYRLNEIQSIYNQLHEDDKDFWLDAIEQNFLDNLITVITKEFELCFQNIDGQKIGREISIPDWSYFKLSFNSITCHNLDLFLTGLLREIYLEYVKHIYHDGNDEIYYSDDLPQYSYEVLTEFLAVWEILTSLGMRSEKSL